MKTAHTVGNKYKEVKYIPQKEINKLIKKDLKKFKDCTFSVYSRHPGAITIKLVSCNNSNYFELHQGYDSKIVRMTNDFIKEIKDITKQYNFDNSDIMSDYFHVNFYVNIIFDYSATDKFKDNLKEVA
tara:strand:+ start:690 stop:1073 length:384 start_codon:yes stop_codon:yes gene_type:complete